MVTISVLDNGVGNLTSVCNALRKCDSKPKISTEVFDNIDGLILPGVGNFDFYLQQRSTANLLISIQKLHHRKIPILGICLGMQLLGKGSEEGEGQSVGIFNGFCRNLAKLQGFKKVPHIGYQNLNNLQNSKLLNGITNDDKFYFVHSYGYRRNNNSEEVSVIKGTNCLAVCEKDNTYGVQFHPEKSGMSGLKIFQNFINIVKQNAA